MQDQSENVTRLLLQLSTGDKSVFDQIVSILHKELIVLAQRIMRNEREVHVLETRALIDEAYMSLVPSDYGQWNSREDFLKAVATAMRHILVDYARGRDAGKRGSGVPVASLNDVDSGACVTFAIKNLSAEFEMVNKALKNFLSLGFTRKHTIVHLHYILQMSYDEISEALGISTKTVSRELKFSVAWLNREIRRIFGNDGCF